MDASGDSHHRDLFSILVVLGEDLLAAARLLRAMLFTPSPSRVGDHLKHIRSLEAASNATLRDAIRDLGLADGHAPISALQATVLLRGLDDAMDALEEAAGFVEAYAIEQRTDQSVKLASFLARAAGELLRCITGLRDGRDISTRVQAVAGIEDEADEFYRAALGSLMVFGGDTLHAIRWKDIYDRLEEAIDRCEEAAQLLGGVGSRRATEAADGADAGR